MLIAIAAMTAGNDVMNFDDYEYCCLESQMPDPVDADTSFNFRNKQTCEDYLREALEALQKAQNHENWDKYNLKVYHDVDLNLEDAIIVLQAAIAKD